jgi:hypothetical protein
MGERNLIDGRIPFRHTLFVIASAFPDVSVGNHYIVVRRFTDINMDGFVDCTYFIGPDNNRFNRTTVPN